MVSATVSLDFEQWDHKPSTKLQYKKETDKFGNPKTETRVLGARLGTDVAEVTPDSLSKAIAQGRTWSPFIFRVCPDWRRRRRIEDLFSGCQVLGVDYDNGDSIEDIKTRADQLGIKFNILHHSFSSKPEHPKFRGIIFLDEEVNDLETAKVLSTGLAYALGGDTVCVDVARMYFGSNPDSILLVDSEATTSVEKLRQIADSVEASKYVVEREKTVREYGPEWGTIEDQRRIWNRLSKGKRQYVKRKILGILREIESFDGKNGSSRYECVWRKTSRIARMPECIGNVVYAWVMERIENNPHFDDWDKDADSIVRNAIAWSFEHSEPPV